MDIPALLGRTDPIQLSVGALGVIVLVAAALSIPRVTWRWFGLFTTLVHELGHAFAALATGRLVRGIRIHHTHAGSATSSGRGALGSVVSGFFGYPAPALVGAAQLWCVFNGYAALALSVGAVVIVLALLFIRNLFGALVVIGSAAVSAALWFYAAPVVQGAALLVVGVALLVGSVRGFVTVVGVHTTRRSQLATSDAYLLFQRSGIPSAVWLLLFAAVIGGSLWAAAESFLGTLR